MGVTGGLIALAAALAVATVAGVAWQRRAGRFRAGPGSRAAVAGAGRGVSVLTAADLGSALGEQATLLQFSTAFCAPCRPTRQMLARVAGMVDGVAHVEIDAAARLDLARQADVLAALGTLTGGGSDSHS
jgi:thiol-disulfide isomerase/thioredoxin